MSSLFDHAAQRAAEAAPRPVVDISKLGALVSVVATDTEGVWRFEHGDLITSPAQFFDLVRYRRAVPT